MTGRWKLFVSAVLFCGAAACGTAASAPGRAPAPRPAREKAPARPEARAANDARAAHDARVAAAVEAVENGGLSDFAAGIDPELANALRDLSKADLQQVTALAALREFGRYFGRIPQPTPEQRQTLRWLATRPRLLPVLMMAVGPTDAPEDVLAVLAALHQDQGDRLDEYADLTTALCVVWDAPPAPLDFSRTPEKASSPAAPAAPARARRPADPKRAVSLFRYFVQRRSPLAADVKALPWQLSAFLVDTPLGQKDMEWALKSYGNRRAGMGRIYFEVPYESDGQEAELASGRGPAYTLANIRANGGVCLDQAYFAANVTRAVGIPAAICSGQSGTGRGIHAWVGYLQRSGRGASWNFSEGRYADALFWSGEVIDPQGGPPLKDAEVCLTSELTTTSPEQRLASAAMCKARDLVGEERAASLYMRAIDLSPGSRLAWIGLGELGSAKKLTTQQIELVTKVLNRFAVEKYPDFAFAVYRKLIAGKTVDEQLAAMQAMEGRFTLRPDLVATVRLARGDLLRAAGRRKEALAAFADAMSDPQRIGPILPSAMDRVDAMLRESKEMSRLVSIYRSIWTRTPPPQPGGYMDLTPFVMIGRRYERALRDTGDRATAATVAKRLAALERGKRT